MIVMFGSIVGVLICGMMGIDFIVWFFAILAGSALVVMFVLASWRPGVECTHCAKRMKPLYVGRSRGPGEDLFLVCNHCKVFVDAHVMRE
jgi:hypothetical protein